MKKDFTIEELYYYIENSKRDVERFLEYVSLETITLLFGFPYHKEEVMMYSAVEVLRVLKKMCQALSLERNYLSYYLETVEYRETFSLYQIYLEEIKKLCQKMGWDNEMKIFAGFSYLLAKGYLSFPKSFSFYDSNHYSTLGLMGAVVIEGRGCCRHVSSLLRDLLLESGYISRGVVMCLDKEISFLEGDVDILKMFSESKDQSYLSDKQLRHVLGNHMVTLVSKNTFSYMMDPLNRTLFFVEDGKRIYQSENKFYWSLDTEQNIVTNLYGRDIPELSEFQLKTDVKVMEELIFDYASVWNSRSYYHDLFDLFYLEHKELYQEILVKKLILKKGQDNFLWRSSLKKFL